MSWEVPTMQSKTSCFNKTLFRKHVTRFWPVWGVYLAAWLLEMPVALLSRRQSLSALGTNAPMSVQQAVLNGVTDESWNNFQEQARAIGSERYIELYQNAYDAYLAK